MKVRIQMRIYYASLTTSRERQHFDQCLMSASRVISRPIFSNWEQFAWTFIHLHIVLRLDIRYVRRSSYQCPIYVFITMWRILLMLGTLDSKSIWRYISICHHNDVQPYGLACIIYSDAICPSQNTALKTDLPFVRVTTGESTITTSHSRLVLFLRQGQSTSPSSEMKPMPHVIIFVAMLRSFTNSAGGKRSIPGVCSAELWIRSVSSNRGQSMAVYSVTYSHSELSTQSTSSFSASETEVCSTNSTFVGVRENSHSKFKSNRSVSWRDSFSWLSTSIRVKTYFSIASIFYFLCVLCASYAIAKA